jgi:5'(3')-deoxyribonucleotidase
MRFEGQGILYTAPHNLGVTGFLRVSHWMEVAQHFASVSATSRGRS